MHPLKIIDRKPKVRQSGRRDDDYAADADDGADGDMIPMCQPCNGSDIPFPEYI